MLKRISIAAIFLAFFGLQATFADTLEYTVELFPKEDTANQHLEMSWSPATKKHLEKAYIKDRSTETTVGWTWRSLNKPTDSVHFLHKIQGESLLILKASLKNQTVSGITGVLTEKKSKPKKVSVNQSTAQEAILFADKALSKINKLSKKSKNKVILLHKEDSELRDKILEQLQKPQADYLK